LIVLVEDGEGFKSFKDRGKQEAMPPPSLDIEVLRYFRGF